MKKLNIYSKLDFLLPTGRNDAAPKRQLSGANKKSKLYKPFLLAFLLLGFTIISQAQELEEIIQKHIEAHGGADKWNAIENMKITAQFTAFSEVDDWMAIKTREGKYYSELSLGKFDVVEAFNGKQGWTIDPWHEFDYPRLLNKAEENVFFQKSEWMTPFFNYKEKGLELEYLGEEDLEGVAVYAIKVTRPIGNFELWYLSKDSYLEYKRVSMWVDFTYPSEAETYFEDFREVQGLVIPFYVEKMFSQRNRVLEIEKVELNVEVSDGMFKMPQSKEMEKFNFLMGEWAVAAQAWSGRANRWYPSGETTSNIQSTGNNLIEENVELTMNFVMPMKLQYSYHATSHKYRLNIYNGFSSEMDLFIGEWNDSTFVAENTQVSYGGDFEIQSFGKITLTPIDKNNFTLFIQNSFDKGETWTDLQKLTYSRVND